MIQAQLSKLEAMKFNPGQMVMTAGIAARISGSPAFSALVVKSIKRHLSGDWGDLCEEDRQQNEEALTGEGRLFSVYKDVQGEKIWIITEWDRSVTTVLFPDEY